MAAGQDGLHRPVEGRVVSERPGTGGFQAGGGIRLGQAQHVLGGAQSFDDAVGEETVNQLGAGWADGRGPGQAPVTVMGEEGSGIGRQVVAHGASFPGAAGPAVGRYRAELVVDRHHPVAGFEPQRFANQYPGYRVESPVELQVAIPVHTRLLPDAQVRGDGRQGAQYRPLDVEARQRRFARGAVTADSGFLHHPAPGLGVEIDQIAESLERQEVALHVFDAGFDDALLLGIVGRTRVDLETVAFGAVGVGSLHLGVILAGFDDGALGVVDVLCPGRLCAVPA